MLFHSYSGMMLSKIGKWLNVHKMSMVEALLFARFIDEGDGEPEGPFHS